MEMLTVLRKEERPKYFRLRGTAELVETTGKRQSRSISNRQVGVSRCL